MCGVIVGHQGAHRRELEALGRDLIEQPRQLARELGGVVGMGRVGGEDQPGQQQLAPQARQRRRQLDVGRVEFVDVGAQLDLVAVDVAERQHARQQQRRAVGVAQEGVAQGTAGAPGRQQDGDAGQRQRVGIPARIARETKRGRAIEHAARLARETKQA